MRWEKMGSYGQGHVGPWPPPTGPSRSFVPAATHPMRSRPEQSPHKLGRQKGRAASADYGGGRAGERKPLLTRPLTLTTARARTMSCRIPYDDRLLFTSNLWVILSLKVSSIPGLDLVELSHRVVRVYLRKLGPSTAFAPNLKRSDGCCSISPRALPPSTAFAPNLNLKRSDDGPVRNGDEGWEL